MQLKSPFKPFFEKQYPIASRCKFKRLVAFFEFYAQSITPVIPVFFNGQQLFVPDDADTGKYFDCYLFRTQTNT
jgi:hypothetical protein